MKKGGLNGRLVKSQKLKLRALFALLGLFARILPTRNASGEVLDIVVTKFLRGFGCGLVCRAFRIAAVSYDERVFIFRQHAGKLRFGRFEIDRSRDMSTLPGFSAVRIEQSYFFGRNLRFQFSDGNILEL